MLATTLALRRRRRQRLPLAGAGRDDTRVDQLYTTADIVADPEPVDAGQVAGDARLAHELLLGVTATVGSCWSCSPRWWCPWGSGVAAGAALLCVVLLRTRQYRTRAAVLVGPRLGAGRAAGAGRGRALAAPRLATLGGGGAGGRRWAAAGADGGARAGVGAWGRLGDVAELWRCSRCCPPS